MKGKAGLKKSTKTNKRFYIEELSKSLFWIQISTSAPILSEIVVVIVKLNVLCVKLWNYVWE